jgi:hypothetical protein
MKGGDRRVRVRWWLLAAYVLICSMGASYSAAYMLALQTKRPVRLLGTCLFVGLSAIWLTIVFTGPLTEAIRGRLERRGPARKSKAPQCIAWLVWMLLLASGFAVMFGAIFAGASMQSAAG